MVEINKKIKNVFIKGVKNGDDKEALIIALAKSGLDLSQSADAYNQLVTMAITKIIKKAGLDLSKIKDCEKLVANIVKKNIGFDPADALKKIKMAVKTLGVDHHDWVSTKPLITKAVEIISKEEILANPRQEVEAKLVGELFITEKEATGLWSKIRAKYGITARKTSDNSKDLEEWFVENPDSTDEEIAEKSKSLGLTPTSVKTYGKLLRLAKEIAQRIFEGEKIVSSVAKESAVE